VESPTTIVTFGSGFLSPVSRLVTTQGRVEAVAVALNLMLCGWLGSEPASAVAASKPDKPKVYVVYVTVVEIDSDGHETILFTPKVQTTGDAAGATVEHADGRSFEFNCKLAASASPALERPPAVRPHPSSSSTVPQAKPKDSSSPPVALTPASGSRTGNDTAPRLTTIPTVPRSPDAFYVRNYDVSDLVNVSENVTDADFAPLIETLKMAAVPNTWTGKAMIRPFTSTKSLVVRQNDAGHKAVAAALKELRPRNVDQGKN
jgi:hypothetical protein